MTRLPSADGTQCERELRRLITKVENLEAKANRLREREFILIEQAEEDGLDRDAIYHVLNVRSRKAFCGERRPGNLLALYREGLVSKHLNQD